MTRPNRLTDDILRHLADLVGFDTVSSRSNLGCIDHVEAFAAGRGARCRRFPNPEGDKASLLMTVGPDRPGGLVLSGHTDVVPVEGQSWTGDPFALREAADGRVIGRGTTDMKGFLACAMAALPQIAALPLARPVHLAFSYDEEVGCTGVVDMAAWVGATLAPRLAVIGEPTMMGLVSAHKGGRVSWVNVKGKPGHSSQPDRGVDAIGVAAELIVTIRRMAEEMRATGPRFGMFDPPWSTLSVTRIQGGNAGNIIAEDCRFFVGMRLVPGVDDDAVIARLRAAADRLEPAMKAVDPACGIAIELVARIDPLQPMADRGLEAQLLALLGREAAEGVSYGTEAGIFAAHGTPSVVVGPGTIEDAHQPDESIAIAQLEDCTDFLLRLAQRMCCD